MWLATAIVCSNHALWLEPQLLIHHLGCVYFADGNCDGTPSPDKEGVRQRAEGLLGCGATDVNKVNALGVNADGSGVCLSNGNGK